MENKEQKHCKFCEKPIPDNRVYCSHDCRNKGYFVPVPPKKCIQCGDLFYRKDYEWPSMFKKRKYCGYECSHIAQRINNEVQYCHTCGKIIKKAKGRTITQYNNAKYCSHKCYLKSRAVIYSPVYCLNCGKQLTPKVFAHSKEKLGHLAKRKFCSRLCHQLYKGESSIELIMREELERRNIKHIPQAPIGKYIADFLLVRGIIVECDGTYWHSIKWVIKKDTVRDLYLNNHGYTILRFTEDRIRADITCCVDEIEKTISLKRLSGQVKDVHVSL